MLFLITILYNISKNRELASIVQAVNKVTTPLKLLPTVDRKTSGKKLNESQTSGFKTILSTKVIKPGKFY